MDEITKILDNNIDYVSHEICGEIIYITIKRNTFEAVYPYCGSTSNKEHSLYQRAVQDLPIQGKKVILRINTRKMFCGACKILSVKHPSMIK